MANNDQHVLDQLASDAQALWGVNPAFNEVLELIRSKAHAANEYDLNKLLEADESILDEVDDLVMTNNTFDQLTAVKEPAAQLTGDHIKAWRHHDAYNTMFNADGYITMFSINKQDVRNLFCEHGIKNYITAGSIFNPNKVLLLGPEELDYMFKYMPELLPSKCRPDAGAERESMAFWHAQVSPVSLQAYKCYGVLGKAAGDWMEAHSSNNWKDTPVFYAASFVEKLREEPAALLGIPPEQAAKLPRKAIQYKLREWAGRSPWGVNKFLQMCTVSKLLVDEVVLPAFTYLNKDPPTANPEDAPEKTYEAHFNSQPPKPLASGAPSIKISWAPYICAFCAYVIDPGRSRGAGKGSQTPFAQLMALTSKAFDSFYGAIGFTVNSANRLVASDTIKVTREQQGTDDPNRRQQATPAVNNTVNPHSAAAAAAAGSSRVAAGPTGVSPAKKTPRHMHTPHVVYPRPVQPVSSPAGSSSGYGGYHQPPPPAAGYPGYTYLAAAANATPEEYAYLTPSMPPRPGPAYTLPSPGAYGTPWAPAPPAPQPSQQQYQHRPYDNTPAQRPAHSSRRKKY
jgi:hypothetical protein